MRWEGRWITGYSSFISAMDVQNIAILGPGSILGSSAIVGRVERTTQRRLPALFEFNNCNQLNVADLRAIHVTGFTGPLLSTHNVTGTGLAAAVPFDPLTIKAYAVPDPIPQPATPYQLH